MSKGEYEKSSHRAAQSFCAQHLGHCHVEQHGFRSGSEPAAMNSAGLGSMQISDMAWILNLHYQGYTEAKGRGLEDDAGPQTAS